jgi:hypothetical protein
MGAQWHDPGIDNFDYMLEHPGEQLVLQFEGQIVFCVRNWDDGLRSYNSREQFEDSNFQLHSLPFHIDDHFLRDWAVQCGDADNLPDL